MFLRFLMIAGLTGASACTNMPSNEVGDDVPAYREIQKKLSEQGVFGNSKRSKRRAAIKILVAEHNAEVKEEEYIDCEFRKATGTVFVKFRCWCINDPPIAVGSPTLRGGPRL